MFNWNTKNIIIFSFVSFIGTRRTRVCGVQSIKCYQLAERKLYGESVINGSKNDTAKIFREICNCLPSCTYVQYDADIDRAKLNWVESQMSHRFQFHPPIMGWVIIK